jgi:hypothetical protein
MIAHCFMFITGQNRGKIKHSAPITLVILLLALPLGLLIVITTPFLNPSFKTLEMPDKSPTKNLQVSASKFSIDSLAFERQNAKSNSQHGSERSTILMNMR